MPLYEYRCKQCGHIFEKIQSFSAPDETECPKCQGELERLISAPAFQFKGSGWYVNDYAPKSAASKPSSNTTENSTNSSEKTSTPSEKPAAPATAAPAAKSE